MPNITTHKNILFLYTRQQKCIISFTNILTLVANNPLQEKHQVVMFKQTGSGIVAREHL